MEEGNEGKGRIRKIRILAKKKNWNGISSGSCGKSLRGKIKG